VFLLVQKLRQEREPLIPFALFRNRNFTLMNWVSCTLSIGMLGIFLPLTIYLQSALGFSALKAGLTLAPSSLVMIFAAPFLGKLTDKTGGKYILICGLTLFAVGMGWVVLIATPRIPPWYDFLPALIVAGLGMGGTFAPLTTVAMREGRPADGRRRLRRAQHHPPGRFGDRHRGGGGAAAEPPGGLADQPGHQCLGQPAAAGPRAVRERLPAGRVQRP